MLRMNDLADSLSHTWESVSHGWNNLINNAGNALTHFGSSDDKEKEDNIPVQSPRWGLMSADVFDDTDKLVVKLETPGLGIDDFDINLIDNVLSISGEKRFQKEESKGNYRLLECAYGQFTRSIPLDYQVDADSAKATYDNGVLKVELKKKPDQKRRQIKVS